MKNTIKSTGRSKFLLRTAAAGLVALFSSQAQAAAVTLCAQPFTKLVVAGVNVPMWGYSAGACGNPSAPGPVITVPTGDTALTVTLINSLPVPTSIVLAAQALPSAISADGTGNSSTAPVMAPDVVGPVCSPSAAAPVGDPNHPLTCRVRSFTGETAPGTTRVYTFSNLRPGTYLYQSGTHPQVQVQMGLAGMARVYPATPTPGVTGDAPVVLSEIDVAMHQRIATTLGGANPASWKAGGNSTLNYTPGYFLVNGRVFGGVDAVGTDTAATDINVQAVRNQSVRLRIANAGLQSRSLVLNRGMWSLVGEDGYDYAAPREQASLLLPAGKTTDANIVVADPVPGARLALFDNRDGSENTGGTTLAGGQVARIVTSATTSPFLEPINDQVAAEAVAFLLQAVATNTLSYTLNGALPGMTIDGSGLLSWPSPTGAGGTVTVNAWATAGGTGARMSRTFNIKVINHKPVMTTPPAYRVVSGALTVAAPGLLAFASDADGDAMTAAQVGGPLAGLTLAANGGFSFSEARPATDQVRTFQAMALDATGLQSAPVPVTLNLIANVPPVANTDGTPTAAIQTITVARNGTSTTTGSIIATPLANRQFAPTVLTTNDSDAETSVSASTLAIQSWSRTSAPVGTIVTATRVGTGGAEVALPTTQNEAAVVFSLGTLTFTPRTTRLSGDVVPNNGLGMYQIRYTVKDTDGATSNVATAYILVQLAAP
ncbi:MAG: hypothetical protein ABL916_20940 [Burkholderiaceae bacterium]